MKLVYRQFRFVRKSRRLMNKIWKQYYALKKKEKLSEDDKFFIRQTRAYLKNIDIQVWAVHRPTNTVVTQIYNAAKFDRTKKIKIPYKDLMNKVLIEVRDQRVKSKIMKKDSKIFDGAYYNVIGGVIEKPNLINDIAKKTTSNDPFAHKKPRHNKKNYIGVELEFNTIPTVSQQTIAESLKNAGLARYVNVTTDGSCGWEVCVLLPEDEFVEPLSKIMNVIKDLGHGADARCGTHVHFDMRNRDVKLVYENLFKTQRFLRKFITRNRKIDKRYCEINKADTFDRQLSLGNRYHALNVESYSKFKTIEVRMHQGTLNPSELVPWIKLLLKIVNYHQSIDVKVNTLKQARKTFEIEESLSKNLEERIITLFKKQIIAQGVQNV